MSDLHIAMVTYGRNGHLEIMKKRHEQANSTHCYQATYISLTIGQYTKQKRISTSRNSLRFLSILAWFHFIDILFSPNVYSCHSHGNRSGLDKVSLNNSRMRLITQAQSLYVDTSGYYSSSTLKDLAVVVTYLNVPSQDRFENVGRNIYKIVYNCIG